mmetsp:Transcript_46615/g.116137  ORF Transcript_46615/g.116137 Transcript_46615/m.116137 type:complete len:87 (+) Transcript_46615:224-484(+)
MACVSPSVALVDVSITSPSVSCVCGVFGLAGSGALSLSLSLAFYPLCISGVIMIHTRGGVGVVCLSASEKASKQAAICNATLPDRR